jgi:hypothetical protein
MEMDLAKLIKFLPLRILGIHGAEMGYLALRLKVHLENGQFAWYLNCPVHIICANAVAYSIQPTNPNTLMGGPLIEYHTEHELLNNGNLQMIPGTDGEVFKPPLKFALLIMDQSYVIAETFVVQNISTEKRWPPTRR